MKKIVSLFIAFLMVVFSMLPVNAFEENVNFNEWEDVYISQQEFNQIVEEKTVSERASSLIVSYSLGIDKSGDKLIIAGRTFCTVEVTKSGFKEVVIQRRANSSQEWVDYVTYEDLYDDSPSYFLSKSITVGAGYQYRVTAVHYAKKNIFSTQKIENISNVVTM